MKKHSWIALSTAPLVICFSIAADRSGAETTIASLPLRDGLTTVSETIRRVPLRDDTVRMERVQSTPSLSAATPSTPSSELWYVLGDGGGTGSSATFTLSYTTGQGSVGKGNSGSFELNRGFWQSFNTSCCIGKRGNVDMAGIVDVSDLCKLVSYLSGGGEVLSCMEAGNVSGSGIVDLVDLSALINYLTGGGYVLSNCP